MNFEMKGSKKLKIIILVIVAAIIVFAALANFITDWIWFAELGYVKVFLTKLLTQIKIGVPVFVIVGFLSFLYLKHIRHNFYEKIDSNARESEHRLSKITWLLALVFSAIVTYIAVSQLWFKALQFFNSSAFGIEDPLYGNDISFYVFKLPFIEQLNGIIIGVTIVLILLTLVYYSVLLTARKAPSDEEAEAPHINDNAGFADEKEGSQNPFGNTGFGKMFEQFTGQGNSGQTIHRQAASSGSRSLDKNSFHEILHIASRQLVTVGIIFFIMVAVHFFLKQFDLLQAHRGVVYGAGFTDTHITLWMYRILVVLALISIITFIMGVVKKNIKTMIVLPVIMVLVGILCSGASALCQNFVVSPNELAKESKYLEYNIKYTQYAYGLDNVTTKSFAAAGGLTSADISSNKATISNIRINDYSPTQTFYNQTQSIRPYYDFNDVDIDRYVINGEYSQVYLSPREINEENINQSWLNRHMKYTHGYGVTLSKVDSVTSSGQPNVLIGNIPPESKITEIAIERPEIYFGELTNDYLLVNGDEKEFDYPDGDTNKYCQYEGNAGIRLSFINRILFSIREGSLKLLVASNIDKDSKIVINRNIKYRVETIMPYLSYDRDPYMCTVDGKLYWIYDAYTTTDRYPYSEPYETSSNLNYIRNSVKIVIDAYNGDTSYYIMGETDPISKTLQSIYPTLFKDYKDMPEGLKAHIRYPNTMFEIQANVYQRYHMNDVSVFYQDEDRWSIAEEMYGTKQQSMTPNYYILSLPGEKDEEFVNTIPYTPKNKKNMTGLLMARNDGDHYGELILYKFPKSKVVYGPMQVEAQIDQNTEISQDFSLWSSSGTTYSRGNLFVIPIEDSLLYVEPVYLQATNSSIPEVKKVIVVYNDQIAYESTLSEALNSMFGEGSTSASTDTKTSSDTGKKLTQADYIEKAQAAYDNAQEALKNGNWTKYGEYMDQLEKYLNKLQ